MNPADIQKLIALLTDAAQQLKSFKSVTPSLFFAHAKILEALALVDPDYRTP